MRDQPAVFQISVALVHETVTRMDPSGEKVHKSVRSSARGVRVAVRMCVHDQFSVLRTRAVLSRLVVTSVEPSGENAQSTTSSV